MVPLQTLLLRDSLYLPAARAYALVGLFTPEQLVAWCVIVMHIQPAAVAGCTCHRQPQVKPHSNHLRC